MHGVIGFWSRPRERLKCRVPRPAFPRRKVQRSWWRSRRRVFRTVRLCCNPLQVRGLAAAIVRPQSCLQGYRA
jgi:hypothetical protein